ncbi:hypothetical protein GJ496_011352 [Pomphorhynchus laevis]|nr:hypothetical protein GJ496_011352 [Pomphorhynchus laevis]
MPFPQNAIIILSRRLLSSKHADFLLLKKSGIFSEIIPEYSDRAHRLITNHPQAVYSGFDPTAPSLHLGHLLCIINLVRCQRAGHNPIAVVGGATALVGDPSSSEFPKAIDLRKQLSNEEIISNSVRIQNNILKIFENHQQCIWNDKDKLLAPVRILNNLQWYESMNFVHFLSKYGRLFRVGEMMSRKCVKRRMETEVGMSYSEFSYQIMQSYDWIHLFKKFNCKFQIGGHDQLGNIKCGADAIRHHLKTDVYGLCVPLLTDKTGSKMSKSSGTAIWLDESQFSPFELYQHLRNTPDSELEKYLQWFTFLDDGERALILREHKLHPERYVGQIKLAKAVVTLVHGANKLKEALVCSEAIFNKSFDSLAHLDQRMANNIFKGLPKKSLNFRNG